MRFSGRLRVSAIIAAVAFTGVGSVALAQTDVSGPTVALDRYELTPGELVSLTIDGFQTDFVTMTFCGNDGRRGSVDCNMQASLAREINPDGAPTLSDIRVAAPPAPCPCIIRVSSQDNQEIAVASVTIVGHPVGPVVQAPTSSQPLTVAIAAEAARQGFRDELRSSLGGATTWEVTVQVKNQGTFTIDNVGVSSTVTRLRYDDVRTIDIPSAGQLEAGETWEQVIQVDMPALTFGEVEWAATASGAGPSVSATDSTSSRPFLLIVLAIVLIVDLLVLTVRLIARVRRRRAFEGPKDNPFLDDPDNSGTGGSSISGAEWSTPDWSAPEPERSRQLVS